VVVNHEERGADRVAMVMHAIGEFPLLLIYNFLSFYSIDDW
jgi:hypothetical protein